MATLDLRPLSLGELLDRTFSLYRRNFLLFVGLSAIPYAFFFVGNLTTVFIPGLARKAGLGQTFSTAILAMYSGAGLIRLVAIIAGSIAFLFSIGASIHAVSEIYAGRVPTIRESLASIRGKSGTIFGVTILNFLLLIVGLIAFVVPFFIVMCRTSVAIAAAVVENLGPATSIKRSFALTRGYAGRAFMIFLLYFAIVFGIAAVLQFPFTMLLVFNAKQPHLMAVWMTFLFLGSFISGSLVFPVSTISFTLFYYDLRVRKEAFDLQTMMQAIGADPATPSVMGDVPSLFGRDAS